MERLALAKVLLSHFAELHDAGVAHRDVSDHSLWLERPSKVSISGFLTAYFPEAETVGPLRDTLRAGKTVLPEDSEIGAGEPSDPFRRDVYLLGVVLHHVLFLRLPRQEDELFLWEPPTDVECVPELAAWFSRALNLIPTERFANARAMLEGLTALTVGRASGAGIDLRAFEPYRTDLIPMVVYPIEENLKQGQSHLYKSTIGGRTASVKVWYGRKPDVKRPEETHQLQTFLEKARLLKTQPCSSLAEVIDFGISDAGTFLALLWLEGRSFDEAAGACTSGRQLAELCRRLVKAALHLHGMGLQHGDLSPSNVVVEGDNVRFLDAIDMAPGGDALPVTPAYAPTDHEAVALDQRDCYAVAKMCEEGLRRAVAWEGLDPAPVLLEIGRCLSRELRVYALDRIDDALAVLLNPPAISGGPTLTVRVRQLTSRQVLAGDNGAFHVGVSVENARRPDQQPHVVVSLSGVRKRLVIHLKAETLDFASQRMQEMAAQSVRANGVPGGCDAAGCCGTRSGSGGRRDQVVGRSGSPAGSLVGDGAGAPADFSGWRSHCRLMKRRKTNCLRSVVRRRGPKLCGAPSWTPKRPRYRKLKSPHRWRAKWGAATSCASPTGRKASPWTMNPMQR